MAYYINDKEIADNIDINYVIDYFKNKGETCIRIMYGRTFKVNTQFPLKKQHCTKEGFSDNLIIEPLVDKESYVYQDGSRIFLIDRKRGSICVNPYFDKTGIYDIEHSLTKDLHDYCLDYKQSSRDKKLNSIINEI